MTIITDPVLEPLIDDPDSVLSEDMFTTKDVAIPCECLHSTLGDHLQPVGEKCFNTAVWRVTINCDCRPRHSHLLCTDCKIAGDVLGAFFNAERIK